MSIRIALTLAFLVLLLVGCASYNSSRPDKEKAGYATYNTDVYPDQPIEEIRPFIWPITENYFEILDNGDLYLYMQARDPRSNRLFGLLFENKKLIALLLGIDVTDFHVCHSRIETGFDHWSFKGVAPYKAWIMERNQLISGRPSTVINNNVSEQDKTDVLDVVEGISYVPIIAVFLPIYAVAPDGLWNDWKTSHRRNIAKGIQIGASEAQLIDQLGKPDRHDSSGNAKIYTYILNSNAGNASYAFGLVNGVIVWRESASMLESVEAPQDAYFPLTIRALAARSCGSLDTIWSVTREDHVIADKAHNDDIYDVKQNGVATKSRDAGLNALKVDIKRYCRKAETGDADAQTYIGDLYYLGAYGIQKDLIQAYIWYSLAAHKGNSYPKRKVSELAKALTSSELIDANRRLKQWKAGNCEKDLINAKPEKEE